MIKSVLQSLISLLALHVLTCHIIVSTAQEFVPEQSLEGSLRTLDKLRETREGLMSLQKVLHEIDQDLQRQHSSMGDIERKRRGLEILKRILSEMDTDLIVEQKRMCRINLGGHCATESAAAVADQWHYLNSPLSPGKRKRRDLLESARNKERQIFNRHAKSGRKQRDTLFSKLLQAKTAK